jgi:hypothetical protein
MSASKSNKQNFKNQKINFLVAILKVTDEKIAGSGVGSASQGTGTDPRIRIRHTAMQGTSATRAAFLLTILATPPGKV